MLPKIDTVLKIWLAYEYMFTTQAVGRSHGMSFESRNMTKVLFGVQVLPLECC